MFAKLFRPGIVAAAIAFALAGCQSGDGASKLKLGLGQPTPPRDQVSERDLRAYCPPLQVRSGTAFYDVYKNRAEQKPQNVVYQAAIDDVTRSCAYGADGSATLTAAIAGRVVPGPVGSPGKYTLPIRVAILRAGTVVSSQLYKYTVNVADTAGATQFIYNNPAIVLPAPVDSSLQVFVGFDRGPDGKGQ